VTEHAPKAVAFIEKIVGTVRLSPPSNEHGNDFVFTVPLSPIP